MGKTIVVPCLDVIYNDRLFPEKYTMKDQFLILSEYSGSCSCHLAIP